MRVAAALAALTLAGSAIPFAHAQEPAPEPVPIEEWSLEKVSRMGEAIFLQDRAAWVSTDALLAYLDGAAAPAGMAGWIVVGEGDIQTVRYVRDDAGTLKSAFDVTVANGRAGPVTPVDEVLPDEQAAQHRARLTAARNIGRLRCARQLNAVALDDPDGDGWLVWLLTPTPENHAIPIGGHYRFHISADGETVVRRDQLSNTCFFADPPPRGASRESSMLFYTQIVSRGPVETQVFLSIQKQMTIVVAAGGRYYSIGGRRIGDITDRVNAR